MIIKYIKFYLFVKSFNAGTRVWIYNLLEMLKWNIHRRSSEKVNIWKNALQNLVNQNRSFMMEYSLSENLQMAKEISRNALIIE